jgi:hypothetical protein
MNPSETQRAPFLSNFGEHRWDELAKFMNQMLSFFQPLK